MSAINYVTNGESGNETVLNRPLKQVIAALGIPDVDDVTPAFMQGITA